VDRGSRRLGHPAPAAFVDLVAGVYDAALSPGLWQDWLARLCAALSSPVGTLVLEYSPGVGATGYFAHGVKADLRGWFFGRRDRDPSLVGGAFHLAPGEVSIVSEAVPAPLFLKSPFYREWLQPQGLRHCLAAQFERGAESMSAVGVMRRRGAPRFGEAERDLLQRIIPHLRRALRVQGVRGLGEMEREAAERIGEALRVGALLANDAGHVLVASRRAAALLGDVEGPHLEDGRLVARTRGETRDFQKLVADATGGRDGPVSRCGGALVLSRKERPGLVVLVSPLRAPAAPPNLAEPSLALVILRAPEDVPVPSEAELRSLFGLTPAEARVACHLVDETVDEIAAALDVSVTTVRTHVQRLLAKTGTRRQSELVRLLVSGPWLGC
jgi:DNA-binding CsgD family transcriptional regulator